MTKITEAEELAFLTPEQMHADLEAARRDAGDPEDHEYCDECGADVTDDTDMISASHSPACSLHPDNAEPTQDTDQ